jgi:hypothetical protein
MASQQTYLSKKEEALLSRLQTGCAAYTTSPEDAETLRSLRERKLILVWKNANWSQSAFDVTYSCNGCYPNYVEDGNGFRLS